MVDLLLVGHVCRCAFWCLAIHKPQVVLAPGRQRLESSSYEKIHQLGVYPPSERREVEVRNVEDRLPAEVRSWLPSPSGW